MNAPQLALVLGVGLCMGFGGSYLLMSPKAETVVIDNSTAPGDSKANTTQPAPMAALRSENEELRARVQELKDAAADKADVVAERDRLADELAKSAYEIAHLKKRIEDAATPAEPGAEVADHDETGGSDGIHIPFEQFAVLNDVEWSAVGDSLRDMIPIINQLTLDAREGKKLNMQEVGKIATLNASLVKAAVSLDGKIPGSGINGSFTHPAFQANAIVSALESAGMPLDEGQTKRLEALSRKYTDSEAARNRGYGKDTWALTKVIDETREKDRFFAEAFGILNPEQEAAIHPEATRGYLGFDLFSSGLVWAQHIGALPFAKREDLENQMFQRLKSLADIDEARDDEVREAVASWIGALPESLLTTAPETVMGQPMMRVSDVFACAETQMEHLPRLIRTLGLTDEQSRKMRRFSGALYPLLRK